MKVMEKMIGFIMDRTSNEEKHELMAEMMEQFFATMTPEDTQRMMDAMMSQMMEGVNMMAMMPRMRSVMDEGEATFCIPETREGGQGMEMAGMPQMMMHMMPHCLEMMLPQVAKDQRRPFTLQMVETLMEHCCGDMSEEEKQQFVAQVMEKIHAVETV